MTADPEQQRRSDRIGGLLDTVEAHASPWGPATGTIVAAAEAAALAGDESALVRIVETLCAQRGSQLLVSGGVNGAGASR